MEARMAVLLLLLWCAFAVLCLKKYSRFFSKNQYKRNLREKSKMFSKNGFY